MWKERSRGGRQHPTVSPIERCSAGSFESQREGRLLMRIRSSSTFCGTSLYVLPQRIHSEGTKAVCSSRSSSSISITRLMGGNGGAVALDGPTGRWVYESGALDYVVHDVQLRCRCNETRPNLGHCDGEVKVEVNKAILRELTRLDVSMRRLLPWPLRKLHQRTVVILMSFSGAPLKDRIEIRTKEAYSRCTNGRSEKMSNGEGGQVEGQRVLSDVQRTADRASSIEPNPLHSYPERSRYPLHIFDVYRVVATRSTQRTVR